MILVIVGSSIIHNSWDIGVGARIVSCDVKSFLASRLIAHETRFRTIEEIVTVVFGCLE
jgi:hypothetical protein